jgi:hypothetical protein
LVIGEDLIDAEGYIGEEKGGFNGIPSARNDAPSAEENGGCDGYTDQDGVYVADFGEGGDTPEEVDGGGYYGRGGDEEADLVKSLASAYPEYLGGSLTIQLSPLSLLTTHRVI